MEPSTPQPTLSQELRALIHQRNILSTKTKSKVIRDLDNKIAQDQEKKKLDLRFKIIEEVLTSELSYLKQLEIIRKYFKEPLENSELMSKNIMACLFGNLESLYNVNGELLHQLKINTENVGAAFQKMAPFFKLYSVYAYDYKYALSLLQDLPKSHPRLNEFIQNQESRPEVGCKLSSLLITPIQRIPRYRMLLRELLMRTPTSHPHYPILLDALAEVEKATTHINDLVHYQENMERVVAIQRCFTGGCKPVIVTPGRKLIKEGRLLKVSKNGNMSQERYFILLTDCVLYCKITGNIVDEIATEPKSLNCCCMLPLKKCSVELVLSHNVFKLSCLGETLILYSDNSKVVEEWVAAILTAKEKYQDGLITLRKKSSSRHPLRRKELLHQHEPPKELPRKRKHTNNEGASNSNTEDNLSPVKMMKLSSTKEKENQETSKVADGKTLDINSSPKKSSYMTSIKTVFRRFGECLQHYWFPTNHTRV